MVPWCNWLTRYPLKVESLSSILCGTKLLWGYSEGGYHGALSLLRSRVQVPLVPEFLLSLALGERNQLVQAKVHELKVE